MPQCPQCRNPLPLRALLGTGPVCPHCHSELEPKLWTSFWIIVVSMTVLYSLEELICPLTGRHWALGIALTVYVAVSIVLNARFARFRLKKPLSIK